MNPSRYLLQKILRINRKQFIKEKEGYYDDVPLKAGAYTGTKRVAPSNEVVKGLMAGWISGVAFSQHAKGGDAVENIQICGLVLGRS